MLKDIRSLIDRSRDTAVEDALGALLLFSLLFAGLSLPGLY